MKSSASRQSPSKSRKATSGSTIQNSVRCRRVFDFSARNVGPKQYTFPNAAAAGSRYSWPDCDRYALSPK